MILISEYMNPKEVFQMEERHIFINLSLDIMRLNPKEYKIYMIFTS